MDADLSVGGDSGAPWVISDRAYGGHKGDCGGLNVFSKAAYFDEALGVTVMTTP